MLRPGSCLYGLMIDSSVVWSKAQKEIIRFEGQDHHNIVIQGKHHRLEMNSQSFQPFGTPYSFTADGIQPHKGFLINIPAFIRVADHAGLELIDMYNCLDFFEEHRKTYGDTLRQIAPSLFDGDGRIIRHLLEPLGLFIVFAFRKRAE
eukprot:TRINITY_DN6919_c0_g1_i1.p1 TRINITY_DN6919_c0_g1~~TRINITY_DN6919_c0_g1_i1.p1  ORF type:complete len:148 (+),score=14.91 TRINITY_DN6919_c0_g1_i1:221-664(+)